MKSRLLSLINGDPLVARSLFQDQEVLDALSSVGVLPKVLELHAPSTGSRKSIGLGATLCGRNGTRHGVVTCKQCRKKLDSTQRGR